MNDELTGSEGDPRSPLWVIGRDYGEIEHEKGKPFQGLSGSYLNQGFRDGGIRREKVFIDNVVRQKPPANDWERHAPGTVIGHHLRLQRLIKKYKPKVVVALGEQAFYTCMNQHPEFAGNLPKITEGRGFLWDSPLGCRVLPSIHPAYAAREWSPWMKLLWTDLGKAAREVRANCPAYPQREVIIVKESAQLEELRQAMLSLPKKAIAIDVENDKDINLRCLGVAVDHGVAYVIPNDSSLQLTAIQEVCESNVPKVLHNRPYDHYLLHYLTMYDAKRTRRYGFEVNNVVADTMKMWHVLQPELAGSATSEKRRHTRKSLAFLVSIFLRDTWWKDYSFSSEDERSVLCGKDCCTTLELKSLLEKELRQ